MSRARFTTSGVGLITDTESIERLARCGEALSCALIEARSAARPGVTPKQLTSVIEDRFGREGVKPVLRGLQAVGADPFPAAASICVNGVAVNGVPSDEPLRRGDVLTIDAACELDGFVLDAACSVAVGMLDHELARAAHGVLQAVLGSIAPGLPLNELAACARSEANLLGVDVADEVIAHGVGRGLHMPPAVFFDGVEPDHEGLLQVGMVLAIEPVVVESNSGGGAVVACRTASDGWSRIAPGLAAFEERTVLVTENGPRVLTEIPPLGFPAA
ncbi:MAG: M24 family metallopeptidase [Phycisphaera sp.]|nr:MAG: M24 family metallopeptidase [Phycisphaera sp.]